MSSLSLAIEILTVAYLRLRGQNDGISGAITTSQYLASEILASVCLGLRDQNASINGHSHIIARSYQ
jgi:hypothetical protein